MDTIVILTLLRVAALIVGGLFWIITLRAYLRSRAPAMLWLLTAVGLLIAGALIEGFLVAILDRPIDQAHVAEAVTVLGAFIVLLFSVLVHRPGGRIEVEATPEELESQLE